MVSKKFEKFEIKKYIEVAEFWYGIHSGKLVFVNENWYRLLKGSYIECSLVGRHAGEYAKFRGRVVPVIAPDYRKLIEFYVFPVGFVEEGIVNTICNYLEK